MPLLERDDEHGFAQGQYENDRWVRCPMGCGQLWDKAVDGFAMFAFHVDDCDGPVREESP